MTQANEQARHETTRRDALRIGGAAAAVLAGALGGGTVAIARQATPATDPVAAPEGSHVVIRIRQVREDSDGEALLQLIRDGYVPLIEQVPGFISYTALADPASQTQIFISTFLDEAGTDESTRLAAQWLEDNAIDDFEGDAVVVEGDLAFTVTPEVFG